MLKSESQQREKQLNELTIKNVFQQPEHENKIYKLTPCSQQNLQTEKQMLISPIQHNNIQSSNINFNLPNSTTYYRKKSAHQCQKSEKENYFQSQETSLPSTAQTNYVREKKQCKIINAQISQNLQINKIQNEINNLQSQNCQKKDSGQLKIVQLHQNNHKEINNSLKLEGLKQSQLSFELNHRIENYKKTVSQHQNNKEETNNKFKFYQGNIQRRKFEDVQNKYDQQQQQQKQQQQNQKFPNTQQIKNNEDQINFNVSDIKSNVFLSPLFFFNKPNIELINIIQDTERQPQINLISQNTVDDNIAAESKTVSKTIEVKNLPIQSQQQMSRPQTRHLSICNLETPVNKDQVKNKQHQFLQINCSDHSQTRYNNNTDNHDILKISHYNSVQKSNCLQQQQEEQQQQNNQKNNHFFSYFQQNGFQQNKTHYQTLNNSINVNQIKLKQHSHKNVCNKTFNNISIATNNNNNIFNQDIRSNASNITINKIPQTNNNKNSNNSRDNKNISQTSQILIEQFKEKVNAQSVWRFYQRSRRNGTYNDFLKNIANQTKQFQLPTTPGQLSSQCQQQLQYQQQNSQQIGQIHNFDEVLNKFKQLQEQKENANKLLNQQAQPQKKKKTKYIPIRLQTPKKMRINDQIRRKISQQEEIQHQNRQEQNIFDLENNATCIRKNTQFTQQQKINKTKKIFVSSQQNQRNYQKRFSQYDIVMNKNVQNNTADILQLSTEGRDFNNQNEKTVYQIQNININTHKNSNANNENNNKQNQENEEDSPDFRRIKNYYSQKYEKNKQILKQVTDNGNTQNCYFKQIKNKRQIINPNKTELYNDDQENEIQLIKPWQQNMLNASEDQFQL